MSWREFWIGEHAIYVSARHKQLHYERIAADIAALLPADGLTLLDHGCGEALAADRLAARCAALLLYDAAPGVQDRLRQRFAGNPRIGVLSTPALEALPQASLDMVVANSLLQYLSPAEFEAVLAFWAARLKPGGRLLIADVIPPGVGLLTDVKALLGFAWQGGFLFAALLGLARTFFSDYRKLRAAHGLTAYAQDDMLKRLAAHGFDAMRAPTNLGHNAARMSFVATRRGAQ